MPWKKERTSADQIQNDRPVNQLFVEAVATYMEKRGQGYEVRTVPARMIQIPKGFEATPEGLAIMRHSFTDIRQRLETGAPVMVLERAGGSLWSYDDVHAITACHELAPLAMVRVVIIGYDPTPAPAA